MSNPFRVHRAKDLLREPAKKWLLKGLIADRESCMIYGPPKSGKTMVTFDAIGALLKGDEEFAGRFAVREPVPVVYATAEGRTGLKGRVFALDQKYGFTPDEWSRFGVVYSVPSLFRPTGPLGVEPFVGSVRDAFGPKGLSGGLLVIDTWARATGGADENTSKDTTEVLNALSQIGEELDCAVLTIHHANKAGTLRGSTNIEAGLDSIIHVRRSAEGVHSMGCDTSKDSPPVRDVTFTLNPVEGKDDFGNEVESANVEWGEPLSESKAKTGAIEREFIRIVSGQTECEDTSLPASEIAKLMEEKATAKTVKEAALRLVESGKYPISVVTRPVIDVEGRPNKSAPHFFWTEPSLN